MGYVVLLAVIIFVSLFINGYQWLRNKELNKEIEILEGGSND